MADDLFNQLADQHEASSNGGGDALFNKLADEHESKGGYQGTGRPAFGPENVIENLKFFGQGAMDAGGETIDMLRNAPGAVARGIMPTKNVPIIGGQFAEDTANGVAEKVKAAKALYDQGKFSEAAKQLPVVGGLYDYATSHPPAETAGYIATGAALTHGVGKVAEAVAPRIGLGTLPPKPTLLGATPELRTIFSEFKPGYAKGAIDDYNSVISRMKRINPDLGKTPANFANEFGETLNDAMMENRQYANAFAGPAKAAQLKVNVDSVGDSVANAVTDRMREFAPEQAKKLESLSKRLKGDRSLDQIESMLQESNAILRDMKTLSPGAWSQAERIDASKAVLDATTKSFREAYHKAIENFTGDPHLRDLNKEYGAMMAVKNDWEGVEQKILTTPPDQKPGIGGTITGAGKALVTGHPFVAGGKVLGALVPAGDEAVALQSKLAKAVKKHSPAPAPDYPTPPQYAGPGGGPASPGNIPPGTYPGAAGAPAGAYPGANPGPTANYTPSAALPSRGRLLNAPPAPPKPGIPMPGQTYGPNGMGPIQPGERIPTPPGAPPPGMGSSAQHGGPKLLPAATSIPMPGATYGPAGQGPVLPHEAVSRGSTPPGMGVSSGRKVFTAEGQFHPPSEHGPGTAPKGYTWIQDRGHWVLTNVETIGHQMGPEKPLPRRK